MKKDGRLTDAAGYAPTVRRRKLLTNLITRAAERSKARRVNRWDRPEAVPLSCSAREFREFVDWEEAWINAIKEERKCLNPTQYKAQQRRPMPPQYYRAGSPPKKKESGGTP